MMLIPILLLVFIVYLATTYNNFVTIKESRIKNATQEIGNQLKRQADLIPNLSESTKGYMKHEKTIFGELAKARKMVSEAVSANDVQKMINASAKMDNALSPIRVVMESTPELKAAEPTMKLMDELRDTADKVMYARRTLIDLTADYNRMVVTVPSMFVAKIFGFKELEGLKTPEEGAHLEVSSSELKSPKVSL